MNDPHAHGAVVAIDSVDAAIDDVRVEPIAGFPGTAPNEADDSPPRIEAAPSARGRRFGRLRAKGDGARAPGAGMTWNTRFKAAVLLSFLILVSVLIANKVRRGDKAPRRGDDPKAVSPALAIAGPNAARSPSDGRDEGEEPVEPTAPPPLGSPRKPAPQTPPEPEGEPAEGGDSGDTPQGSSSGGLIGASSPPAPAGEEEIPHDQVRRTAAPGDELGGESGLSVPPLPVASGPGDAGAATGNGGSLLPPDPTKAVVLDEDPSQVGQTPVGRPPAPGAELGLQGSEAAPPLGVGDGGMPPPTAEGADSTGMETMPAPTPLGSPADGPPIGDLPGGPSDGGASGSPSPAPAGSPPLSETPGPAPESPPLGLGSNAPTLSAQPATPGGGELDGLEAPGSPGNPGGQAPASRPSSDGAFQTRVSPEQLQLAPPPVDAVPPEESQGGSPRGSTARQAGFTDPRSGARAPRPAREEIAGGEVVGGRIEPVIHVVRRKENFWTISRHYYGSGRFYRALWIANRDRVPKIDELYVGTPILVPAPEDLDKSYIDPPSTDGPRPVAGSRTTSSTDADGRGPRSAARRDDRAERTSRSVEADEEEERPRPQEEELSLPLSEPASRPGRIVPREPKVELTGERPTPRTRRVHVVQPYETLRSIARKELGDARREREILDINEDRIEDPRHLTPGLRLRIPEEETRRR